MRVCVTEGSRVQDHARLKVIAFENKGSWETDEDAINRTFYDSTGKGGYIFAKDFYLQDLTTIQQIRDTAVACLAIRNTVVSEFGASDNYHIWQNKMDPVKRILATKKMLCQEEGYIDNAVLEELKELVDDSYLDGDKVFIATAGIVVGPFKYSPPSASKGITLIPALGKSVSSWNYSDIDIAYDEDDCYFLEEPTMEASSREFICYSNAQLLDWLNKKVTVEYRLSKNQRKVFDQTLRSFTLSEDKIIAQLISDRLEQLTMPFDLFSKLSEEDERINALVSQHVENHITKISTVAEALKQEQEATLNQYQEVIKAAETQCLALNDELVVLRSEKTDKTESLQGLNTRVNELKTELNELIEFQQVLNYENIVQEAEAYQQNFVQEVVISSSTPFEGDDFAFKFTFLSAFSACCASQFGEDYKTRGPSLVSLCERFQGSRLFVTENPKLPKLFAEALGHALLIWQVVPPTWIDYQEFEKAVFIHTLRTCRLKKDVPVILVLEQFNMSPPACYFRQLANVCAGDIHLLPGLNQSWPQNLWIFAIKGKVSRIDGALPVSTYSVTGATALIAPDEIMGSIIPRSAESSKRFSPNSFAAPGSAHKFDDNFKELCDD
jgi:hypothetical protein